MMKSLNDQQIWKSRPLEWSDDERMNALFSPFRTRESNPIYYDAKLNFWKKAIISYLNEFKLIKFKLNNLEDAFIRNGTKPKCLHVIIEALLQDKEQQIKDRNEFIKQNQQGWLNYAFTRLIWSPLSWTTGYLMSKTEIGTKINHIVGNTSGKQDAEAAIRDVEFICLEQLSRKSNEIYMKLHADIIYTDIDCICDYEKFVSICQLDQICVCLDDIDLVLIQLLNEKKVIVNTTLIKNRKLIKFLPLDDHHNTSLNTTMTSAVSHRQLDDITELEFNYYMLKLNELNFEKQINLLNDKLNSIMVQIKENLKNKNKIYALNLLKKHKYFEKQLNQKSQILFNIQNLMLNLQQISTHKLTMDIYKKNLGLIKAFNDENNLDKIEDLMDDLSDNLKMNGEIEDALSKTIETNATVGVDEDELEDELNELLAMESVQKPKKQEIKEDADFSIDDLLNDLPKLSISTDLNTSKNKVASNNNEAAE